MDETKKGVGTGVGTGVGMLQRGDGNGRPLPAEPLILGMWKCHALLAAAVMAEVLEGLLKVGSEPWGQEVITLLRNPRSWHTDAVRVGERVERALSVISKQGKWKKEQAAIAAWKATEAVKSRVWVEQNGLAVDMRGPQAWAQKLVAESTARTGEAAVVLSIGAMGRARSDVDLAVRLLKAWDALVAEMEAKLEAHLEKKAQALAQAQAQAQEDWTAPMDGQTADGQTADGQQALAPKEGNHG